MSEKVYTAKQAAIAVLQKAEEMLAKKYEGFKAVEASARKSGASDPAAVAAAAGMKKYGKKAFEHAAHEGKKMGKSEENQEAKPTLGAKVEAVVNQHLKENGHEEAQKEGKPAENARHENDASDAAETSSKAPKGEIHPKEKEAAGEEDGTRTQTDPQHNAKENAEGNNELAGTTPTGDDADQKAIPGGDELKGHLKLAKFLGRIEHKRGK